MRIGSTALSALTPPVTRVAPSLPAVDGVREGRGNTDEAASGAPSPWTDSAEFSDAALAALNGEKDPDDGRDTAQDEPESSTATRGADGEPLSREEETELRELQARDKEVRAHEEAHKSTAGDLARGGPTYEYQQGPDGRDYAVGGEVQIALEEGRTPEETAKNAQRARRAALAPAEPSAQDLKVAAEASQMEAEARQEAAEKRRSEAEGRDAAEAEGASESELRERAAAYEVTGTDAQELGAGSPGADALGDLFG